MKKVCKICGKSKLLSDFHKAKKRKDGHISQCKECLAKIKKEKNVIVKKEKKNTKPRYNKEYFDNHKEELIKGMKDKCWKCGKDFKNSWDNYNQRGNLHKSCERKKRF
jgi:hypothetical protein